MKTLAQRELSPVKLVAARESKGLTQAEAARRIGLPSRQYLFNYEAGFARPPGDVLARLCALYECRAEDLLQ